MVYLRPRSLEGSLRAQDGFILSLGQGIRLREADDPRLEELLLLLVLSGERLHLFA